MELKSGQVDKMWLNHFAEDSFVTSTLTGDFIKQIKAKYTRNPISDLMKLLTMDKGQVHYRYSVSKLNGVKGKRPNAGGFKSSDESEKWVKQKIEGIIIILTHCIVIRFE